ncbi:protein-glutamine glutaminase family protein [Flavobacterium sp. UMI-01]|uniref:protein-glutamine glutaminase family protein n=1 Tax=Flavobacterium sp. UMI-01 TaxID=1441053 RepID=UPI001C7CD233|nr:protein-glutamine glutaminase family protein [Flavobacterium sp. UMI-01]GIZ10386.1 hypothetical protein FUMI01_31100 [Flavobacterium sp. UMI-01]
MKKTIAHSILILVSFFITQNVKSQTLFNVNEYKVDLKKYPVYNQSQINSAIESVKSSEYFDYHYLNSGCNFKSHYLSIWLKKKLNIETFKVWNFSKSNYYYSGSNERLIVDDPNKLTESGKVNWGFHVAVGVLVSKSVKNQTTIDTLIIDLPNNDREAIPLKYWLASQNQTNSYYTFTDKKFCNFESIVAGIQNNQSGQFEKLINSYNIFAGRFWDDNFVVQKNGLLALSLATDIVVMKYYNEIVLEDNLINQMVSAQSQKEPQIRIKLKAKGKNEQEIEEEITRSRKESGIAIKERRLSLTSPIADYNNLQLPESYKNQLADLTIKIQRHIDDLIK